MTTTSASIGKYANEHGMASTVENIRKHWGDAYLKDFKEKNQETNVISLSCKKKTRNACAFGCKVG